MVSRNMPSYAGATQRNRPTRYQPVSMTHVNKYTERNPKVTVFIGDLAAINARNVPFEHIIREIIEVNGAQPVLMMPLIGKGSSVVLGFHSEGPQKPRQYDDILNFGLRIKYQTWRLTPFKDYFDQ